MTEAALSRQLLHLSPRLAAADSRRILLTGPLRKTNEAYAIAKIAA